MNTNRILLILIAGWIPLPGLALSLSQGPLFLASTEPRVMLVASRDHQLSIKAYTDYSDLDGDGVLDTTYKDSFAYYGYFDSEKCYSYSNDRYEPAGAVTAGTHQCGGAAWSGNFLNWASMTRMDILRKTFYGGYRSTDTKTTTVLERHFLPDDVHAFVKVYTPTGSMPTIQSLTGIAGQTSISLCNVSNSDSVTLTGVMAALPDPKIRVASGSWPQWDSSEVTQCVTGGATTRPNAVLSDYNARVKVCVSGSLEANCKTYTHPTASPVEQSDKPTGLLQKYGDVDVDRRVRFGLMTGSYAANKSGGVLRKNTTLIANNNGTSVSDAAVCGNKNANDEIDVCTGQFINNAATDAGIINTLNRLRIAGFKYSSNKHELSCNTFGIIDFSDGQCVDWGSPLSEIYLETLRYFSNSGSTAAFDVNDSSILASIPKVTWADPLPATQWCALSSIVVLSTGLNSFDTDQLDSFTPTGGAAVDAVSLTTNVGDQEGINGGTYLIGDNGITVDNQCTAKVVSDLADVKGICPEVPSTKGGYGIAGLAYAPKKLDMRPGYATKREARWGGANPINSDWAARQPINTYAVQLAESLPSFSPAVGAGTVTLLPACMAIDATPGAWPAVAGGKVWRNCSMTNLIVDKNVNAADVGTDATARANTCSGNGTTSQCFTIPWEDSTWGNDYDMDGIQRLGYCVGDSCSTFKMLCPTTVSKTATLGPWAGIAADKIVVATCVVQANAGNSLTFGYTITGTTADGVSFPIYRKGGNNFNVGDVLAANTTAPNSVTFTQGASTAKLLENPLWYAAKFGGFTESTPAAGTPAPNLASEWDAVINASNTAGSDGIPDNYFDVKNPANLFAAMSTIFDAASTPDASASSVATNSTNLRIESRVYQAKFSSSDWSGQLLSYNLNSATGDIASAAEWDAGALLKAGSFTPSSRVILTKGASDGVAFLWGNLTTAQKDLLDLNAAGADDDQGENRLGYLRGAATHEGTSTTSFRQRNTSKLGDIVNSSPWYVGAPKAGFSDVDHPGYTAFRNSYKNRLPVVYVAGNDGMLHGFDASLDFTDADVPEGKKTSHSGQEVLAYIPTPVFTHLSKLTDQKYNRNHRFFVDGSPMVGDANLGGSWRTVLVGGLGAGGKGYYALDITNPGRVDSSGDVTTAGDFSETGTAPANTLLWEFDEADMGFAFNMPPVNGNSNLAKQIVKMPNGKWAAVVGNGYNSDSGKAVLYILFINEGADGWAADDYVKIVADATGSNGLSTPVPFDSDGDGLADTVYAGDLKGNLWKFIMPDDDTTTWKVALSGAAGCATCTPLFTATDGGSPAANQPIIWPAEVTKHPNGGQLVMFGTGKYLELTDPSNNQVQTIYGVWDNNAVVARSDLIEQTVTSGTIVVDGVTKPFRTTSSNDVTYPGNKGWYLNLPTTRERVTGVPKLISGTLFFNTFIPSAEPCDSGGTGWLMSLNYLSGKKPSYPIYDTDGDGDVDSSDTIVSGYQVGAALGGTTLISGATPSDLDVGVSSLTDGSLSPTPLDLGGAGARGRINWREIVQ